MATASESCSYREMLRGNRFCYGVEVVTSRGLPRWPSGSEAAAAARTLLADPQVGWISITDSPGGVPMLPPDGLARLFPEHRSRIVIHLTCKDRNRNGLEATAWQYAAEGFENLLALTGDYPAGGFRGQASGVFDLDSLGLIVLLRSMNEGLQIAGRRGALEVLPPTGFFAGCAVSPFKRQEAELMPQYLKLLEKIAAGAAWVIPQLGYDMRKFHEVKLLLASRGLDVPVVGNVYLLNRTVVRLFHSGKLPGCEASDELHADAERYAAGPDKGRQFFIELAAKQLAVFRGLGFAGGYLGGMAKPETFSRIIEMARGFGADDWRDFLKEIQYAHPGEFFLFEHDPNTGLSDPTRINAEYLRSLERREGNGEVTLGYRLSRVAHRWLFDPERRMYAALQRLYGHWDKKPGRLSRGAYLLERTVKALAYGCQDCGDCSLPEGAYLCPMFACSKHSRNGPCGGSSDGRCELGDKTCYWVRAYRRMKRYGESEGMFERPTVFYRAELLHTSSWANRFLERDHLAGDAPGGNGQAAPTTPAPPGASTITSTRPAEAEKLRS